MGLLHRKDFGEMPTSEIILVPSANYIDLTSGKKAQS
jgi:hypothetical protein